LITRVRESYGSMTMSRESKNEEVKQQQQLVEFWQCTKMPLIQRVKMQFSCFPFCQVVQKHKLFEVGYAKHLLIAYFMGSISAKNIKMKIRSHVSKVRRFLRHGVQIRPCINKPENMLLIRIATIIRTTRQHSIRNDQKSTH